MSESSHLGSAPARFALESVEWLPSGAHRGMLRARGTRVGAAVEGSAAPVLMLRAGADVHSFDSVGDAGSDAGSWRAAYVLASELLSRAHELWLAWPDGERLPLPPVETEAEYATGESQAEPQGEVIDRAVIAERRAQRAESAQRSQARAAADALAGLAALERRLEEITAERDHLAAQARETKQAGTPAAPIRLVGEPDTADFRDRLEDLRRELTEARAARRQAERDAERLQTALSAALSEVSQLKLQTAELRLRHRTQTSSAGANAVRVAVLEAERGSWRPLIAALRAEVRRLRERLAAIGQERELDAREVRAAHARVNGLKAQRDDLRGALTAERRARRRVEARAAAGEAERDAAVADADDLRGRLTRAGERAAIETSDLRARVDALSEALDAARKERASALAEADAARHAERSARTEVAAETVARTARERGRRVEARAHAARTTALQTDLAELRATRSALTTELERERRARRRARADADAERAAANRARRRAEALTAVQDLAAMPATGSDLQQRIEALASSPAGRDPEGLQQRAREQMQAASAVRQARVDATDISAQFDAAAAALRVRAANPDDGERTVAQAGSVPEAAGVPVRVAGRRAELIHRASVAPKTGRQPAVAAAGHAFSAVLRPATWLVAHARRGETAPVPRGALRGALVALAREDSFAAARVLASLLPAQGAFLGSDIDYDLTIHELGCFAVTVAGRRTTVRAVRKPRARRHAELHVSADALTLAELLAGRRRRVGRLLAPVRVRGPRSRLAVLESMVGVEATLGDVTRAGARLDPWLVMRALPHAIDPAWTDGHSFTVAQEITGAHPQTWYIAVNGRAGLSVSPIRPLRRPDARVSMPRDTFDRLLAGDTPEREHKPWVWGDFAAVDRLRGWAERARL